MANTILYYVMHKDYAKPLLSDNPNAAHHGGGKLVVTATRPKGFDGEVLDLYKLGFTEQDDQTVSLTEILTGLANREAFTADDLAVIARIHASGGLSANLLTGLVDYMFSDTPTGKLIILSEAQVMFLYTMHDTFKQSETTVI